MTFAPATAAPVGSLIVPSNVPLTACPKRDGDRARINNGRRIRLSLFMAIT
jgi:hypothetical protein